LRRRQFPPPLNSEEYLADERTCRSLLILFIALPVAAACSYESTSPIVHPDLKPPPPPLAQFRRPEQPARCQQTFLSLEFLHVHLSSAADAFFVCIWQFAFDYSAPSATIFPLFRTSIPPTCERSFQLFFTLHGLPRPRDVQLSP